MKILTWPTPCGPSSPVPHHCLEPCLLTLPVTRWTSALVVVLPAPCVPLSHTIIGQRLAALGTEAVAVTGGVVAAAAMLSASLVPSLRRIEINDVNVQNDSSTYDGERGGPQCPRGGPPSSDPALEAVHDQ
jgi:hypothetical protein